MSTCSRYIPRARHSFSGCSPRMPLHAHAHAYTKCLNKPTCHLLCFSVTDQNAANRLASDLLANIQDLCKDVAASREISPETVTGRVVQRIVDKPSYGRRILCFIIILNTHKVVVWGILASLMLVEFFSFYVH